jgi:hypothetical protein
MRARAHSGPAIAPATGRTIPPEVRPWVERCNREIAERQRDRERERAARTPVAPTSPCGAPGGTSAPGFRSLGASAPLSCDEDTDDA